MILLTNFAWRRLQWKPLPVPSIADVPLLFLTVQLYLPETSVTDWAMVSTVSYVPVEELVTTCVCWYVALIVNTVPFFLQVTVVAGPPVEVQVKDRLVSSYIKVVAVGVPTMGEHYNNSLICHVDSICVIHLVKVHKGEITRLYP